MFVKGVREDGELQKDRGRKKRGVCERKREKERIIRNKGGLREFVSFRVVSE